MQYFVTCILAGFVILNHSVTVAQDDQIDLEELLYKDIAADLRCPTCQGLSVLGSDAPFSKQIKDMVKLKIKEGKKKQEILDFFVERYGPWILREPPKTGVNLLAWVVPIILLAGGPVLIWGLFFRRPTTYVTKVSRPVEQIVAEMNDKLSKMRDS